MKIWRMDADGSNQRQMTYDDQWADWFPHPSPDGRRVAPDSQRLAFVSYRELVP